MLLYIYIHTQDGAVVTIKPMADPFDGFAFDNIPWRKLKNRLHTTDQEHTARLERDHARLRTVGKSSSSHNLYAKNGADPANNEITLTHERFSGSMSGSMSHSACVCVCIFMYIYIYDIHIYICAYIYRYIYTYMYIYVNI